MLEARYVYTFTVCDRTNESIYKQLAEQNKLSPDDKAIKQSITGFKKFNSYNLMAATSFVRIGRNLYTLGLISEETANYLDIIQTMVILNHGIYLIWEGITALVNAKTAIETAEAAAQTAAMLNPFTIGLVLLAIASAAAAFASIQFITGSWKLPSFDLSNGPERRQALSNAASATKGAA